MSETIYKYQFRVTDRFMLTLPVGARILAVQVQQGIPCIWAQVDPKADSVTRFFRVFGTGRLMESDVPLQYLGTFQIQNTIVFHLYEALIVQEPGQRPSTDLDITAQADGEGNQAAGTGQENE